MYIAANEQQLSIDTIIQLAELVFAIAPFTPLNLPDDWKEILTVWLKGETLTEHQFIDINDTLTFVEEGLIYRLPWGLEAIRVRAQANEDIIGDGTTINDYEINHVVPAIENGSLNKSAALLMQAGFSSRKAAIIAVNSTNASFTTGTQLKDWLNSSEITELTSEFNWPTHETSNLWQTFIKEFAPSSDTTWKPMRSIIPINWINTYVPEATTQVKLQNFNEGRTQIISSSGEPIGELNHRLMMIKDGVYTAKIHLELNFLDVTYWGPGNNPFEYSVEAT